MWNLKRQMCTLWRWNDISPTLTFTSLARSVIQSLKWNTLLVKKNWIYILSWSFLSHFHRKLETIMKISNPRTPKNDKILTVLELKKNRNLKVCIFQKIVLRLDWNKKHSQVFFPIKSKRRDYSYHAWSCSWNESVFEPSFSVAMAISFSLLLVCDKFS